MQKVCSRVHLFLCFPVYMAWNTLCYTKGMNKSTILLLFISALVMSSCSDERLLDNKLRKMHGNWRFHQVKHKQDSRLFSENVTDDFSDVEWVFNENGDVMQILHDRSDTIFGSFELELFDDCDNANDGGCENIYFIHLYMINGNSVDRFIWEDATIRNQRIRATEFVHKGYYSYVLEKI